MQVGWRFEPTAIIEAIRAVLAFVVLMNWWQLDEPKQAALLLAASAVLAAINRSLVTPNAKL